MKKKALPYKESSKVDDAIKVLRDAVDSVDMQKAQDEIKRLTGLCQLYSNAEKSLSKKLDKAQAEITRWETRKYLCGSCGYAGMGDEETERIESMEKIVTHFAKTGPIVLEGYLDSSCESCGQPEKKIGLGDPAAHHEDCIWLAATRLAKSFASGLEE